MKKLWILGALLFSSLAMKSQSYVGFNSDNYNGVHGVLSNPANIVDSRFKTDINILSASAFLGSDYFGIDLNVLGDDTFDSDKNTKRFPSEDNNLFANADIMGPSFMFNINEKHSIAFFTRARTTGNVSEINGTLFDNVDNDFDENEDFNINEGNLYSTVHGWVEVGGSYATVLLNKKEHFLKGGVSLKYLQGLGYSSLEGRNVNIAYDEDGTIISPTVTTGAITSSGEVLYSNSNNFEDGFNDNNFEIVDDATGFGFDLGFVYEWRRDYETYKTTNESGKSFSFKDKNKYKLKVGLSVTDIGSINYKESNKSRYDINRVNINEDTFNSFDDLDDLLDNLYTETKTVEDVSISLPTALHATVDYNINNKFYLNLNYDASVIGAKGNANSIVSNVSLTPRFESKWFSFYSPIGINKHSGFSWGAGLRAGPIFLGSGSILSNLISKESKTADVYFGLKIPIYQGKPRDRDGDGVLDKLDACPREAGPVENDGCPWGDKDGDSVLDNKDACPEVAGPVENNGCPWSDKDGDTVLDKDDACPEIAGDVANNGCPDTDKDGVSDDKDKCVNVAGAIENNGCPWSDVDKDGIVDKDDKCPNIPGVAEMNGCPKPVITKEAKAKLDKFAKAIYFNSGKTTFKPGVTGKLDLIAKIMNEYSEAKFNIEGHTDSVGSKLTNERISTKRAKAVLDYLVQKAGIEINRLSSVGYGEDYPVDTNKTRAGRSQNRRVEIKLVK